MASDKPKQSKLQHYGQRLGRLLARSSLVEIMLVATLCMARYIKNSDFSYPSEIILNIVLFSVLVTAGFYVYRLIIRNVFGAHIAGLLLTWVLFNFDSAFPRLRHGIERVIPDSLTSFTQAGLKILLFGLVFGVIGYAAARVVTHKKLAQVPALKFLVFVISFIFVVQLGKVGLRVYEIRHDLAYKVPTSGQLVKPTSNNVKTTDKPNVYYLLFDRYANATTLKNVYGYDNSAVINGLQSQGFQVRDDAYANYPFTMQSVSSTLSGNYHTELGKKFNTSSDFQTGFPYRAILNNSPVTTAFKNNGYQYNQVSSWWDFTRLNPSADTNPSKSFRLRLFGKNFWLSDLQRDIVNRSALSPLLLKGVTIRQTALVKYQLDRNPAQNFYAELEALNNIAANAKTQTKPQFTFAHILSPHDPYVFDAQGNTPDYDNNRTDNGLDEYKKYTNQLSFINTKLLELVTTIRTKDPSAVIVLQADEGPYPKQFRGTLTANSYYDPINLPIEQQRQKFGILAAYYLPASQEAVGSSADAFRVVLNQYLGYNLPVLPDCQFTAGDKFKLYNYQVVSGALKNITQPAVCQQYK